MKKRKLFLIALTLIMSTCFLFAFVGCNKKTECAHEWQNTSVGTDATCTEVGSQEQKCTKCGDTQTIELPVLGHNTDGNVAHKDADCTNDGVVGGTYCTRCNEGKAAAEATITALGHHIVLDTTQGVNGYTWATDYSSCTAHGKCDRTSCTHTIDATATVTPSEKQAQSCVNAEIYDYTATFTEAWAETQTKENVQTNTATGHNYGAITIAWNDDYTAFIATRTCSNCKDGVEGHTQTATSTWHGEYIATTLPTCTEAGVADYIVVFDVDWIEGDQTISAIAPAYGHDYTKVNHDDTHHWKECSRCHLIDETTKVEHTYDQTVAIDKYLATSATCQAKATYFKSCECGAHGTETFESGDFADHNYSLEWTIDKSANCTEDGSKSHHCLTESCDSKSDVTTIPSLGHNIVLDTTKGENGYTWATDYSSCTAHGKCDRKGCTHTEDAKAILSLNTIQGATCTLPEKSDIDYSFSVSWATGGRMDLVQTGPALGHNTDGNVDHKDADCTNDGVVGGSYCTRCNDGKSAAEANIPAKGHNFTQEKAEDKYLKSAATCTSSAIYYKSCAACGKSSQGTAEEATFESGNALGHNIILDTTKGENGYTWATDYSSCTAHGKCDRKGCTHTEDAKATLSPNKFQDATCTLPELSDIDYSFSVSWASGGRKTLAQTKPALGHNTDGSVAHKDADCTNDGVVGGTYCTRCNEGKATAEAPITALGHNIILDTTKGVNGYTWATDYSSCTAYGKCDRTGCSHAADANATVTPTLKQAQSCVNAEIYDYTATFTETWAETQTKENVQTNNALGHIDENKDHVCDRDGCTEAMGTHVAAENSHICDYCKEKVSDHTGGTATCQKKATCTVCGDEYGDLDSTNHEKGLVWTKTAITHKHTYECCGAVSVSEAEHEWENGVCTECEYVCGHTGGTATCTEQATCTVCGEKYGDLDSTNHEKGLVWTKTAITHKHTYECCGAVSVSEAEHEWENGVCTECEYVCKHTGGTATCQAKATCTVCGNEYGDFAAHDLEWVKNAEGHYRQCKTENCTEKETLEAHDFKEGVCTVCGDYDASSGTEGLNYAIDSAGTGYEVTGYSGTAENVVIPNYYDDDTNGVLPVVSIAKNAFKSNSTIKTIVFPRMLATMGQCAINAVKNLTTVTFDSNCPLTEIPTSAFLDDNKLTTVVLPNNLTSIGDYAFRYCKLLENVTLPSSLQSIGKYAFDGCRSLTSIAFPDSVQTISDYAFDECKNIMSVTYGTGFQSGTHSKIFRDCYRIAEITNKSSKTISSSGAYYVYTTATESKIKKVDDYYIIDVDGNNMLINYVGSATTLTLPATIDGKTYEIGRGAFSYSDVTSTVLPVCITSIGAYAFYNSKITTITFNEGLENIKDRAFYRCWSLTSVNVPASVTTIGDYAFSECSELSSLTFATNSQLTSLGYSAFGASSRSNKNKLTDVTLPESLTIIPDYAFRYSTSLQHITLGSKVTEIGARAFGDTALTEITIPEETITIEDYAFYKCSALAKVNFNSKLEYICMYAFAECTSLKEVRLPESCSYTSNNTGIFKGCTSLEVVTIPASVDKIRSDWFTDCTALKAIYYGGTQEQLDEIMTDQVINGVTVTPRAIVEMSEKTESCTEQGNIHCWYDGYVDKYYSDAEGTTEITKASVFTAAIGHNPSKVDATETEIEHYHCSNCGGNFSDEACTNPLSSISAE